MTKRKYYAGSIDRALDPIRNAKFYAKGWLQGFTKRNPKAAKSTKLRVWREGYISSLMEEQKRN